MDLLENVIRLLDENTHIIKWNKLIFLLPFNARTVRCGVVCDAINVKGRLVRPVRWVRRNAFAHVPAECIEYCKCTNVWVANINF